MVNVSELNTTCKSAIFKSILNDLIYSFRMSIKKLTGVTADIKLDKIRMGSFYPEEKIIVGNITNLIGGRIGCAIDDKLVSFLSEHTGFSLKDIPLIFVTDYFDCFACTSRHKWLTLNSNKIKVANKWNNESFYNIRFYTKFCSDKEVILSKFVVVIDEIASLYFIE